MLSTTGFDADGFLANSWFILTEGRFKFLESSAELSTGECVTLAPTPPGQARSEEFWLLGRRNMADILAPCLICLLSDSDADDSFFEYPADVAYVN
jgi:hypothetical protein